MAKIIALLTDFGDQDAYTSIMKGVMLCINSRLQLIDVSHKVPAFNILSASYLLYTAWDYFPPGTTFLSVVDPGVGTDRKVLVAEGEGKYLIAPDNGTISMLFYMNRDLKYYNIAQTVIEELKIANSYTFHGRDIFAPIAANLCTYGLDVITAKSRTEPVIIPRIMAETHPRKKLISGKVIHIDHFGNCITSIHENFLKENDFLSGYEVSTGGHTMNDSTRSFGEVRKGHPLCYIGSSGFIEIAVREGNASKTLKLRQGNDIMVKKTN